ncbi:MAG: hypothetical protein CEE38_07005 [Planctomycetes bacterium B3_Pla]|nr:MAG: hypothetical protein CEE38_07005 [Planctomycetes bacterium B3_Pla]
MENILGAQAVKKTIMLIVVTLVLAICAAGAAGQSVLSDENPELRQEVEKLEKGEGAQAPKPIMSNLDIQLYGFLKFDAAYDTSRTDDGNFAKWVESEEFNDDDDQFNMTANQSRFGIKIAGIGDDEIKTSGLAEVDFYGLDFDYGRQNEGYLMMRHAYLKLDWPDDDFSIIAGQTSDVISPLSPTTVNYTIGWYTGNLGYRRPQVRVTKLLDLDGDMDFTLEGALTRTIGRISQWSGIHDSGEDYGKPTVQGRVSTTISVIPKIPATAIGVSAHYGKEEYDTSPFGQDEEFRSWSLNVDVYQPIHSWLTIKGELFTGENLDAYMGGIGQGVTLPFPITPNSYDEVGSAGGWVAASFEAWKSCNFNVGVAMDDVDSGDVDDGDRTLNRSVFANMFYPLAKNVDWAVELSKWRTEYRGPGDAESFRIQTALIYKF